MIIFLLFAALLSFEAVCSLNTIYAASRSKTPWRYTAWADGNFIGWWSKLKWGVFVLGAVWYVAMACAAVLAEQDWFIGFLDFWLYTRIPAWLLLTARAARQARKKSVLELVPVNPDFDGDALFTTIIQKDPPEL